MSKTNEKRILDIRDRLTKDLNITDGARIGLGLVAIALAIIETNDPCLDTSKLDETQKA